MNKSLCLCVLWGWMLLLLLLAGCQTAAPRVPEVLAEIQFEPAGHPVEVASNPRTGYVYITNQGNYVGVLRGTEQIATLQTGGRRPHALAVDEERGWVYVVNEYSDSVAVIRDTEIITTVETAGQAPTDVTVEPRNGWAYVVSGYKKEADGIRRIVEGNVTVISGTQTMGVVPLGNVLAAHVVVEPLSGYVYIGCVGGDIIVVEGLEEITRFNAKTTVRVMDVDPRTGDVYILDADGNLLRVQDTQIVQQVDLWEEGPSPRNMRVHSVTGNVYIVYGGSWMLIVRDMKVIGDIEVGWGALKMAIDPLTGNVYVANFNDNTVAVIHGTELLATLDVGWYPYGIGVNPTNGWVYVSNTNDDTVTILGFPDD
jgi:DNA-binding beta-propeller fold protein YncE